MLLRLTALLYILRRKRQRSIQRKKLYLRMSSVLLNTRIPSDLWPLKMKRNCIVEKSLAVRIVDHKSLALRLSTGLSLYL